MRTRTDAVRAFAVVASATVGLTLSPSTARAQNLPLAEILPDIVLRDIMLLPSTVGTGFVHTAHFTPLTNEPNNPVVGIVQSFNTQMVKQLSTFPLGSSSGGMTYVFDESLGTFRRASRSFGPLFAERALTIGRRKLSVGFNYQHTSYSTFEGQNLADGSIKFYLPHEDCCHFADPANAANGTGGFSLTPLNGSDRLNPPFKGDLVEASLSLKATTQTTALFANFGLTDRWDVGVAVPFVAVNLQVHEVARVIRLVTDPRVANPGYVCDETCQAILTTSLTTHTFDLNNPDAPLILERSGRAAGLGDVVLRTKYRFLSTAAGGLAAGIDLRCPTGDKNELLGAGGVQAKFLLVASDERGPFGHHANLGYTVARGTVAGTVVPGLASASLTDEINYSGGIDFVAGSRLTVMGDVVGRTLRSAGRLGVVSKAFEYNEPTSGLFPGTSGPGCGGFPGFTCKTASFNELSPRPGNLTLLLGTAGVKVNLVGNLLATGSVLFPLTKAGLRNRVTTVAGVDYAF